MNKYKKRRIKKSDLKKEAKLKRIKKGSTKPK